MEEEGLVPRSAGPLEAGKGKKTEPPLDLPERNAVQPKPWFSPVRPISDLWTTELGVVLSH